MPKESIRVGLCLRVKHINEARTACFSNLGCIR